MNVPFVDLAAQHAEIADEVMAELAGVFERTAFVGGPQVGAFESEYAAFTGAAHCVGVANGTDAVELALRGVGVGAGDEVVLPANTFVATAEAVSRIGAVPVLVDVDPVHLLLDPDALAGVLTPRTAAVVPVHLYGQMAPVERVREVCDAAGVAMVEDAAQSQGATRLGRGSGAWGDAAGTSFYPGKNLGAAGDAGGVTTSDAEVAARVRLLGAHGSAVRYVHEVVGMNSRLDTVQAVYLRAKLARLDKWNEQRRQAADRYADLLAGVEGLELPGVAEGNVHVWHLYVVRVAAAERDRVLAALGEAGVGAGIHYPTPLHLTGAYAHLGLGRGTYPVAEDAADRILSLPMHPHLRPEQQERVAEVLAEACAPGGPRR